MLFSSSSPFFTFLFIVSFVCVVLPLAFLFAFLRRGKTKAALTTRQRKRDTLNAQLHFILENAAISDAEMYSITSLSATTLIQKIKLQELSSEIVVRAFSKRAALAQKHCNCITEFLFVRPHSLRCAIHLTQPSFFFSSFVLLFHFKELAIRQAKELDEHQKKTGEVVGPLHGLPVSIKECFDMAGMDATVGLLSECGLQKRIFPLLKTKILFFRCLTTHNKRARRCTSASVEECRYGLHFVFRVD
jgi:hypothetical protein